MNESVLLDAAILLLGHGTKLHADSAAPVYQHAAELRRRRVVREVREACWKQEPRVQEVLMSVTAPRVFLVPLFMSEGYFSEVVIPRGLGFGEVGQGKGSRVRSHGGQVLYYCRPVGTHDRITGVVLDRARQVVEQSRFPHAPRPADTTLFIAGHGTQRNENSRQAIEQQVERVKAQRAYAAVHAIFLEEEPRIASCYSLARTQNLVVVPFFMSDGLHVREDIPRLLSAGSARRATTQEQVPWRNPTEHDGKRVWCSDSVGTHPLVADIILDRVREASEGYVAVENGRGERR